MRNILALVGVAFAVALAVVVGNRLSNEAMAVIVGALCGISASIPVSVALVIAMSRNWGQPDREEQTPAPYYGDTRGYGPQPPVIVISPPQPMQTPYPYPYSGSPYFLPPPMAEPPAGSREFKIIGDE